MIKELKVIQLIDSLNPGGAEMMAVNIANALADEGIDSHICTTRLEGDLKSKLLPTVGFLFLNKKNTLDLSAFIKLKMYIKQEGIQIIHAHSSSYFMAFLIKKLHPSIKIIWHDHYGNSEHLKKRKKFFLSLLSKSFESILSVNRLLHRWAQKHLKVKRQYYLPNFASFNSENQKITFLKGIEGKRIVCLANLRPQKDHINLLKAFKIVKESYPDWTLHLVGMDLNDLYSGGIKTFIKANNLENHVLLYGSCTDIKHILKQVTIGVLASKSEGLPIALLEYGMAKLPVVVTNVGECGSVISNKLTGIVVNPSEEKELATGILSLIKNVKLRQMVSENLKNKMDSKYSQKIYIKQLLSIYKFE